MINDIKLFSDHAINITDTYVVDDNGIDLSKLGRREFDKAISVDLKAPVLVEMTKVKTEFATVISFIESKCLVGGLPTKPIWYRINVIDQAINDYIGIGFLDIKQDWLSFTVNYLSCDRADQSGDTIMAIFDREFTWAVSFTLSQDNRKLQAELFIK
ncbi:hypothetical protein Q0590_33740 [Rhodocytophaga aerolata]|uniref:Phage tail protein n=1 Tax=Rhodocytophaga aerolata TaxID=455078 RepID=A0ABT8RHU0_9BACT|nr:hypothetical protein [Rhodocytophaga aerolata]MDO1451286.1 hypothetical protein [Rhodocytophaga aerolata]